MRSKRLYQKIRDHYKMPLEETILPAIKEQAGFGRVPKKKRPSGRRGLKRSLCTGMVLLLACCVVFQQIMDHNTLIPMGKKLLSWEERSISSKFDGLHMEDGYYMATQSTIGKSAIDRFLLKTTLTGYDDTSFDRVTGLSNLQSYQTEAEVYSVKSIESAFLVAVKYEGQDEYYSFTRFDYEPETLGDLMDDLNLMENLKVKQAFYNDQKYLVRDAKLLWDLMNASRDAAFISANVKYDFSWDLSIQVSMDIAGQDKNVVVSKDGYLFTNLYDTGKVFFIGKERAEGFIEAVLSGR